MAPDSSVAGGIHFIKTVYSMLSGASHPLPTSDTATSPNDIVPGEDDELSGQQNLAANGSATGSSPTAELWSSQELDRNPSTVPTFNDLVAGTKSYFETWHPIFPFLHAPSIITVFDIVSKHGFDSISQADQVIVRALVSVSAADARQTTRLVKAVPSRLVFDTVNQIMSESQFAICHPANIHNLQALVAIQIFLVSLLKFNLASRLGGTIVRIAFHLGLHRCPARFENFDPAEAQLRRRLFFTIYCLDRLLCHSLGLPLGINDTDVDVCYPGEELHLPTSTTLGTAQLKSIRQLHTLTLFAKHAKLRGMILELRNKAMQFRQETANRAMRIEVELSEWSNQLHEIIDDTDDSATSGPAALISPLHQLYLLLLEHESTIALNRPLVTANKSSTTAMSALQNCIKASRSIINILDGFRMRSSTGGMGAQLDTPITWPLVTWCCWMSCFILAFAALEGRSQPQFAIRYADKSLGILSHLSLRMMRWPNLCAEAVRHVKTALIEKQTESAKNTGQATGESINSDNGVRASVVLTVPPDSHVSSMDLHGNVQASGSQESWYSPPLTEEHGRAALENTAPMTFSSMCEVRDLDPFGAIDLSNFTMMNYDFLQGFGSS